MPNTRRRRFSVQNDISGRDSSETQNSLKNSYQNVDASKIVTNNTVSMKPSKNKMIPNNSKISSNLKIGAESESNTSNVKFKMNIDKNIAASSSAIDLYNILSEEDTFSNVPNGTVTPKNIPPKMRDARLANRDIPHRRDKYPRQHRIKVRSPKRRLPVLDQNSQNNQEKNNDVEQRSIEVSPIDWEQEVEVIIEHVTNSVAINEELPIRVSDHSLDDMCRICHGGEALSSDLGQLISACSCRGTVGRVHVKCLERWLTESGKSRCELCGTRYLTKRIHKYGVPRALLMWVLSQNAKQLMVDSLGIMLMSPLAVLAAWLSGRTLAGLMRQDNHAAPWPLASTFVLACMTLVCYYCWIVSAATRHALGWWIWYRSQYEVRLQFEETEE